MERVERYASTVLILFGLYVVYYSWRYLKLGIMISPGAGFLPFYIGIALTVLGILWFFVAVLARRTPVQRGAGSAGDPVKGHGTRQNLILFRLLPGVLLVILYAWLFDKIGYVLSTLFFMIGWQKIVEREGWLKTTVIAVLCAGGMYTLFVYLLKVFLPTGKLFS